MLSLLKYSKLRLIAHQGHPVLVLRLRAGLAPGSGSGHVTAVHPLHCVLPVGGHRGVALHLGHIGGGAFSVTLPNEWNVTFDFFTVTLLVMASYISIFPQLYFHMFAQRKNFWPTTRAKPLDFQLLFMHCEKIHYLNAQFIQVQ